MKYRLMLLFVVASVALSFAQEKKLTRAQLPPAVIATIDREAKGAYITRFATERERGKKVYEAETVINGHSRDLQIAEDGTLNEVEEEVSLAALPVPVRNALLVKAKGATIVKVESLTKGTVLVAYEASTLRNGHKGEVQIAPTGAPMPIPNSSSHRVATLQRSAQHIDCL